MAQESCDLDKDEAEILKPKPTSPPPPSSPPPPATSPSSMFLKPSQELSVQRPERPEDAQAEPSSIQKPAGDHPPLQPAVRLGGNRCSSCRKRVGLTAFRCRCGDLFCPQHRYSDTHDCSFDYKAAGREEISKANPVIRPAKIIRI